MQVADAVRAARLPVGVGSPVAAAAAVPGDLARHRRRRTAEPGRDRSRRSPAAMPREISSRSASVSEGGSRRRSRGGTPPFSRIVQLDRPGRSSSARPISLIDSPRFHRSHSSRRSWSRVPPSWPSHRDTSSSTADRCCDDGLRAPPPSSRKTVGERAVFVHRCGEGVFGVPGQAGLHAARGLDERLLRLV